jgi:hypothetical protein
VKIGGGKTAMLYLMNDQEGIFPPLINYINTIRNGYNNFGLDHSFLDEAIRFTYNNKQHSEQTRERRKRQKYTARDSRLVKIPEELALARIDQQNERRA